MTDWDVIVAGSGPAGLTASMFLARAGYKVCNITGKNPGGNLVNISRLENYPGFESISGYDLWEIMMDQCRNVNVNFIEYAEVIQQDKDNDSCPNIIEYSDGSKNIKITSKAFIECIGGVHNTLGLPNESNFFNKGISFCATCDGPYFKNKTVCVVGGGNSAMDYAITLSKYCKKVIVIHRRNELRATKDMIDQVKNISNIELRLNTIVTRLLGQEHLTGVVVKNNNFSNEESIMCDGLFYALGFSRAFIPCCIGGMHNGTFSAGDCNDDYRQVITACGDGCKAALNCIKFLQENEKCGWVQ